MTTKVSFLVKCMCVQSCPSLNLKYPTWVSFFLTHFQTSIREPPTHTHIYAPFLQLILKCLKINACHYGRNTAAERLHSTNGYQRLVHWSSVKVINAVRCHDSHSWLLFLTVLIAKCARIRCFYIFINIPSCSIPFFLGRSAPDLNLTMQWFFLM